MTAFHNVLCPVDLAPQSEAIIATAASRARHRAIQLAVAVAHDAHARLLIMDQQDDAKNSGATDYVLRNASCPVLGVDRRASGPVAS